MLIIGRFDYLKSQALADALSDMSTSDSTNSASLGAGLPVWGRGYLSGGGGFVCDCDDKKKQHTHRRTREISCIRDLPPSNHAEHPSNRIAMQFISQKRTVRW